MTWYLERSIMPTCQEKCVISSRSGQPSGARHAALPTSAALATLRAPSSSDATQYNQTYKFVLLDCFWLGPHDSRAGGKATYAGASCRIVSFPTHLYERPAALEVEGRGCPAFDPYVLFT